ncbi:Plant organelle RNA recognition domain [Dillenia turbinata]|uniref:Plant organelle RNA recognition domain n=1 Tax=Dillenia turbinata TaxID=194707 RepID=A0AAN8ZNU6_9MAGN
MKKRFFWLLSNSTDEFTCFSKQFRRTMTTSKRVQDRSRKKRDHALEVATEKSKVASKFSRKSPSKSSPLDPSNGTADKSTSQDPTSSPTSLRKSPKLFELYKDHRGTLWCGMTQQAEELIKEEETIIRDNAEKAAEPVTRFLMTSVDKRLPPDNTAHFRRDLRLPFDFTNVWVHQYPHLLKVVKSAQLKHEDEIEYLELVSWNPTWACGDHELSSSPRTAFSSISNEIPS